MEILFRPGAWLATPGCSEFLPCLPILLMQIFHHWPFISPEMLPFLHFSTRNSPSSLYITFKPGAPSETSSLFSVMSNGLHADSPRLIFAKGSLYFLEEKKYNLKKVENRKENSRGFSNSIKSGRGEQQKKTLNADFIQLSIFSWLFLKFYKQ